VIEDCEIIIVEYDPVGRPIYIPTGVRYIKVDRKGIAYARHFGINRSRGEVIVNFDADARYDHLHGLRDMTDPILNKECVLTVCDNIFDLTDLTQDELNKMRAPIAAANVLNGLQRLGGACLEPGSAMSKIAYNNVGGFADIPQHELWNLSHRIMLKYLPFNIRHVKTTNIYMSARRAKRFADLGLNVLDYSNKAFR
jgi:glycosyltransferase involved in cell wall biosynthesis